MDPAKAARAGVGDLIDLAFGDDFKTLRIFNGRLRNASALTI